MYQLLGIHNPHRRPWVHQVGQCGALNGICDGSGNSSDGMGRLYFLQDFNAAVVFASIEPGYNNFTRSDDLGACILHPWLMSLTKSTRLKWLQHQHPPNTCVLTISWTLYSRITMVAMALNEWICSKVISCNFRGFGFNRTVFPYYSKVERLMWMQCDGAS